MVTLDVDFEVFKALTNRRETEAVTYNDVLRDVLGLGQKSAVPTTSLPGWTWKGVTLPNGTELRAEYKGKAHTAKITNGTWVQEGQEYGSPSAAAYAITGSGINGWRFWLVKRPSDPAWVPLGKLRNV